jgi:hypothetical protein
MEAANCVLLPGLALLVATPRHPAEILSMGLSILSCVGFLLVGTFFWAALDRRLRRGDREPMNRALAFADRAERPLLAITSVSTAALLLPLWFSGLSAALAGAAVLTTLAWLEWINYYRCQLQHFDRWSDFRRLLTGRGLRTPHMARALAAHRRAT